ncbi:MAG: RNA polymerase sigma factor [Armatimonadota bacterium]
MIPNELDINFSMEAASSFDEPWPGEWPQSRSEFESFVEVFLDRLVCMASRRLHNTEEAEDVVQEVLLKAYTNRTKLRKVQKVGPYLYRMVINACIERIRQRRKTVSLEDIGSDDVPAACSPNNQTVYVEDLLRKLPVKQAEVLRLRILDEFSLSEIAEIVGCSLPTAKSRLNYGLQKLRRIMCTKEESE